MDNRESCCDAPPSCVWDETQPSEHSNDTARDWFCARVCVSDRKMNLFSDFHSVSHTIYVFIFLFFNAVTVMLLFSVMSVLHLRICICCGPRQSRQGSMFCHLYCPTHLQIDWYVERDELGAATDDISLLINVIFFFFTRSPLSAHKKMEIWTTTLPNGQIHLLRNMWYQLKCPKA